MQQNSHPQLPWHIPDLPGRPIVVPMLPTRVRQPGRQAPLPDAVAIQQLSVPDSAPPYDDELRAGQGLPGPAGQAAADWADLGPDGPAGLWADSGQHADIGTDAGNQPNAGDQPDTGNQPDAGNQPYAATEIDTGTETDAGKDSDNAGPPPAGPPPAGPAPAGPPAAGQGGTWPSQFAQVLAETLAGSRPAQQLTPWTTEQARRRIRQLGPLLATDQRPRVRRVITSAPASDVLELAAVVGFGSRVRLLAVRLEREQARPHRRDGGWCCTAIESA